MQRYPVGVMISRGGLAIEADWRNMPRIQNEILRLSDSAFIPNSMGHTSFGKHDKEKNSIQS